MDSDIDIPLRDLSLEKQLEVVATANNIIFKTPDDAGDGLKDTSQLTHRYGVYKLPLGAPTADLCSAVGTLTGFFSRKAKGGVYQAGFKMKHNGRFIPITEMVAPREAPSVLSFSSLSRSRSDVSKKSIEPAKSSVPVVLRCPLGDSKSDMRDVIENNRRITERSIVKWSIQLLESLVLAHTHYITLGPWDSGDVCVISDDAIVESFNEVRTELYNERYDGLESIMENKFSSVHGSSFMGIGSGSSFSRSPSMASSVDEDDKKEEKTKKKKTGAGESAAAAPPKGASDGHDSANEEDGRVVLSVVKGRVGRDAWFSFSRWLARPLKDAARLPPCHREQALLAALKTKASAKQTQWLLAEGLRLAEAGPHRFSTLLDHDGQCTGKSNIR
jgi:hypothetical protein